MHNAMFDNQTITGVGLDAVTNMANDIGLDMNKFNECVESGKYADEVAKDLQEGSSYGVSGTPTFFINGVRLVGAQPLAAFTAVIDDELKNQ
jgi:protein-disulfide isomerase